MKNELCFLICILIIINIACTKQVKYLDDDFPGLIPKIYAPGTVNIKGRYLQNITMSSNGEEVLLGQTDSALFRYERILRIKNVGSNNIKIDTPQFVKNFKYVNVWFIGEPMMSRDDKNLYFIADYPPNYWCSTRTSKGDWSVPVKMDSISTNKNDWYISASNNNTLYFSDGRIHFSKPENGKYLSREKMEGIFNEEDAGDPCISPNEDYMVFGSTRDGVYGECDIYVTFKDKQGNWTKAFNLGKDVNTKGLESAPYISPDEKYLFFSRRDKWQNASYQNIYIG